MRMQCGIKTGLQLALVICLGMFGNQTASRAATAAVRPSEPILQKSRDSFSGSGIRRHSFLMVGEENPTIFMVKDGKVTWTYRLPKSKRFTELDDVTQLTNGNIVFDTGTGKP